ncbi:MAG: M15 family metallopeptidase [Pseudomonadota bacterium]
MVFRFGERSRGELEGVHPDLVHVCYRAIELSTVDFGVFDGLRTAADQNALYRRGASQIDGYRRTGRHQPQPTGYGHAVDLVPWIDGRFRWDWPAIYEIAAAVHAAACEADTAIRWGGCWEHINPLCGEPEHWVAAYVKRKRAAGKRAFNDGPHFELYGAEYNSGQPVCKAADAETAA